MVISSKGDRKPLRVCVVAGEFLGLADTTLLSASISAYAQEIAALGDSVTALLVVSASSRAKIDASALGSARRYYLDNYGIKIELLSGSDHLLPQLHSSAKASLAVYNHLKATPYDVVYFANEGGLGYYTILAREVGIYLTPTRLNVLAQEPIVWEAEADRFFLSSVEQVAVAHMERYTAEYCDELILTSGELKRFLSEKGWSLPRATLVMPAFRPAEWMVEGHSDRKTRPVDELVFFGPSSFRGGLTLFCDILDKLADRDLPRMTVIALGPFGRILGEHTGGMLLRRARRWPFTVKLLPKATPQECLSYLRHRNCLVVSPCLAAAAPFEVTLCLEERIPFVASRIGDVPDMIATADRDRTLAIPTASAFADKIEALVASGASAARPTTTLAEKRRALEAHLKKAGAKAAGGSKRPREGRKDRRPLVSIVLAHHDRPNLLPQAIESVKRQDYAPIELIVVDDGSVQPESHKLFDELEGDFAKRGWRILREPNKYLGAARNAGIKVARGERILFLDDDNILLDNAVSTFVSAMDHSGADICTCLSKILYGSAAPTENARGLIQYFPLGGSLDLGLLHNSFGDANAMIRKSVFDRIGLLVEDYGFVAQDWEFFARAAFNGLKVRIIPEALYWYRSDPEGMYRSSHWWSTRQLILKLYRDRGFKGLTHLQELVLAQNVDGSEIEGYQHNLLFSPSDAQHFKLRSFEPNSEEALKLLAEIAASEGRADTAIQLLGQSATKDRSIAEALETYASAKSSEQIAVAESIGQAKATRLITEAELRDAEIVSHPDLPGGPLTYTQGNDKLYLEALAGSTAIAVLRACSPAGVDSVSSSVFLDEYDSGPAEFMLFLADVDEGPVAALERAAANPEGSSGWRRVSRPYEARVLEATLASPSPNSMSVMLAVRAAPDDARPNRVLGCFSYIRERRSLDFEAVGRRPRRQVPLLRQRARLLQRHELLTATLVTKNGGPVPSLEFPDGEEGLLLRPNGELSVAALPWGFPPFAQKIVASVEVADGESLGFEFAMALVRPDHDPTWTRWGVTSSIAFSGWHRVEEAFELKRFAVAIPEVTRTHLKVHLAVRADGKAAPLRAQTFWRKLALHWS